MRAMVSGLMVEAPRNHWRQTDIRQEEVNNARPICVQVACTQQVKSNFCRFWKLPQQLQNVGSAQHGNSLLSAVTVIFLDDLHFPQPNKTQ